MTTQTDKRGMRCAFVGAGNLATHLAQALQANGHEVVGVCSRTEQSARTLAERLGCPATTDPAQLPSADVCFFSVKDDVLPDLARQLTPRGADTLFVHTAGSVPMDVFRGVARNYGVLYPMQTFSKARAVDFRHIPCFVEASDTATLLQLQALAADLSDTVVRLDSERRRLLHLAAVYACNFVNHCCDLAGELMERGGLRPEWLLPLIDETAAKLHDLPAREAQTGPAVRYDRSVMDRQRELAAQVSPEMAAVYAVMSESIYKLTQRK